MIKKHTSRDHVRKLQRYNQEVELLVAERTAALKQSEERRRILFESTTDAIFVMNAETIFDCNPATLLTFGSGSREEILGKRPDELSPLTQLNGEESRVVAERIIERALTEGVQRFEWLHCRLDNGENFIAEVCLTPLELNNEIFLQAIVRDITIRKNAEKALAFKNMILETQSETSLDGVLIVDSDGHTILWNGNFRDLWNIPRDILESRDDTTMLGLIINQLNSTLSHSAPP
jgi:PAS domain S-box-containing protein